MSHPREQQLEELEALTAIFEREIEFADKGLAKLFEEDVPGRSIPDHQRIAFDLNFSLALDEGALEPLGGAASEVPEVFLHLCCELPLEYPRKPARCEVTLADGVGMTDAEMVALNKELAVRCEAASAAEEQAIYTTAMHAKQVAEEHYARTCEQLAKAYAMQQAEAAALRDNYGSAAESPSRATITRTFFWSHHTRRKQLLIYEWAAELRISGRLTVSRPGYTFVEGTPSDMKEFTKRNMGEHWKEIRITWSETAEPPPGDSVTEGNEPVSGDGLRLFPDGMKEVLVDEFIEEFRALGREDILEEGTRGAVRVRREVQEERGRGGKKPARR
ncbi:hypothetical protein CYMTET_9589 [Cymbomonas tetramitiformis]|uniref:RWD domain-containing protein n=1 Tax=Cymbomonas tetramitiformis TaxID=36881 RepID=A0AAE0GQP3_9CHLO|nr:hypothetical protein CYMTET_56205 [Cymbomonas tetramitiformis]KAK3282684.1 hypothetical protein CYMTET_9589 [Cymbomonas tetramitiformis]